MRVWLSKATLEVLTHADHARIITGRAVYLRALCAPLKFIETTGSSFTRFGSGTSPVSISNISTLQRLLTWIDAGQSCCLTVHLLLLLLLCLLGSLRRLLMLRVGMSVVHDVLLRGKLVLVCIVVEVVAAIHAIIVPR